MTEAATLTTLRLSYQTIEFGKDDIHLCTLRSNQEFSDPEGIAEKLGISSASWPIFGIIWPSSLVLADHMSDYDTGTKRILEVGCGIALSSLLLNKRMADITATDYHPEVEYFLQRNALLNGDTEIAFEQVDWSGSADTLGQFDLIIGSDLLYENEHIDLLADFINAHANPSCEVIIVDPGRGRKTKLSSRMIEHGYRSHMYKSASAALRYPDFKGHILQFLR